MFITRAMCGLTYVTVAALCSSCSLQKYLERWPAALNGAGLLVLMLMKGPKIPRTELNTVICIRIIHCLCPINSSILDVGFIASVYATCPSPRLNLKYELRPSWNNIHDTFPTGDSAGYNTIYAAVEWGKYFVLSSGVRLIFYTPDSDNVLQAISIKHVTN